MAPEDFKIASVPGKSSLVQLPNRIVPSTACFERTGTLEVSFHLPSKSMPGCVPKEPAECSIQGKDFYS